LWQLNGTSSCDGQIDFEKKREEKIVKEGIVFFHPSNKLSFFGNTLPGVNPIKL
jgi:hypothetical protein